MSYHDRKIPKSLLTVAEAADELGVCTRTIHRYIAEGRLPAYKLKHQHRIKRDDLDRMLFGDGFDDDSDDHEGIS